MKWLDESLAFSLVDQNLWKGLWLAGYPMFKGDGFHPGSSSAPREVIHDLDGNILSWMRHAHAVAVEWIFGERKHPIMFGSTEWWTEDLKKNSQKSKTMVQMDIRIWELETNSAVVTAARLCVLFTLPWCQHHFCFAEFKLNQNKGCWTKTWDGFAVFQDSYDAVIKQCCKIFAKCFGQIFAKSICFCFFSSTTTCTTCNNIICIVYCYFRNDMWNGH